MDEFNRLIKGIKDKSNRKKLGIFILVFVLFLTVIMIFVFRETIFSGVFGERGEWCKGMTEKGKDCGYDSACKSDQRRGRGIGTCD